jgi:hypothetical protein
MKISFWTAPVLALALCTLPAVPMQAQPYAPPAGQAPGWDAPPQEFHDIGRRGFHDGIEAAHQDMDAHRAMNPRRHEEFRRPPVPGAARREYREGFERGYRMGMRHWREHHDWGH